MSDVLATRLGSLERRVLRVEERLGLVTAPPPVPVLALPVFEGVEEARAAERVSAIPGPPPEVEEPPHPNPLPLGTGGEGIGEALPWPTALPPGTGAGIKAPVVAYAPVVEVRRVGQSKLEQTLGLKWAGWIGAVVLVIGAGLGIKFAYDQGWLGAIPDALKLVLMSFGGVALIGVGEWVYRRVNRVSAAGLFGAGVAVLFLVSYAGHGFYQLYARNTAFALMGLSTLVGAGVAIRGNLVSIAVLSLIGGNLAPVVLNTGHPSLPAFFAYLVALQVVALALAAWGNAGKWSTLRGLSLGANALWVWGTLARYAGPVHWTAEVAFLVVAAGLYQLELAWTTGREPRRREEREGGRQGRGAPQAAVYAMLVTAGLVAGVLAALGEATAMHRGAWVLGIAGVSAAVGFGLPRREGRADVAALKVAHRVCAAGLLVVAVPVMFTGLSVEVGWGVAALAFAVVATAIDSNLSRVGAVACWALTAWHLIARAADPVTAEEARRTWVTVLGTGVPAYAVLAAALALIGQGVAYLVARRKAGEPLVVARVLSVAATLLWGGAAMGALPTLGATVALIAAAWVLVVVDAVDVRLAAAPQAVALLAFATGKWVFADLLAARMSGAWTPGTQALLLTPAMGVGAMVAGSLLGLYLLRKQSLVAVLRRIGSGEHAEHDAAMAFAGAILVLIGIGLTFEIDRVVELVAARGGALAWPAGQLKQLLWTMLWSSVAAGQMAVWRAAEPDVRRRRAWAHGIAWVPTLLVMKFGLFDTLWFRVGGGSAHVPAVANLQTMAGAFAAMTLLAFGRLHGGEEEADGGGAVSQLYRATPGVLMGMVMFVGWVEIERAFENLAFAGVMSYADARLAEQVAVSIFNAVAAVTAVAFGFRLRVAKLRYAGLALFGITVVKVFLVDLSHASQGYRVLSFIGLGALLLGTSVLYGKLSPRMLGEEGGEVRGQRSEDRS